MKPVQRVSSSFPSATPCAKEKGKWFSVFRFSREWAQLKFPATPRRSLVVLGPYHFQEAVNAGNFVLGFISPVILRTVIAF